MYIRHLIEAPLFALLNSMILIKFPHILAVLDNYNYATAKFESIAKKKHPHFRL